MTEFMWGKFIILGPRHQIRGHFYFYLIVSSIAPDAPGWGVDNTDLLLLCGACKRLPFIMFDIANNNNKQC